MTAMENPQAFNPFDILNTPWAKLPLGTSPAGMANFDLTDLNEMDKRISELKAVEQWLSLNLTLLKTTIQGLEVQRGTIAAIKAFTASAPGGAESGQSSAQPAAGPAADQANLWWSAMQQQFGQMMAAAQAGAQSMMETKPQGAKRAAGSKKAET
ncbi:MAG: hypothetical protein EBR85_08115 [Betaproteobacteria bacterium]|nr:hypothetical protein [Betaproteobacteria bacterium]